MRRLRFNRLAALIAIFALFCATSGYLSHGYDSKTLPHKAAHCDLCLQFSGGAAGAAPSPKVVHVSTTVIRLPLLVQRQSVASDRQYRAHQPRAPPADPLI